MEEIYDLKENSYVKTIQSLYITFYYVFLLVPVGVSGGLLACAFDYQLSLYFINFPIAGLIFIGAIIIEMNSMFM